MPKPLQPSLRMLLSGVELESCSISRFDTLACNFTPRIIRRQCVISTEPPFNVLAKPEPQLKGLYNDSHWLTDTQLVGGYV